MIKQYIIESDNHKDKSKNLNINQKIKHILNGKSELLKAYNIIEIWKVLLPYEVKLILIIKKNIDQYKIYEAVAISPDKNSVELLKIEFNTILKNQDLEFLSIIDRNNY